MSRLGERLRHERESRNTTIEQIADATQIRRGYLEALEKNEFDALPGPAFGKLYIRAYAETLGFDPTPLIDAYDSEQRVQERSTTEPAPPQPARPRRVGAAISRWREAKLAERNRSAAPVDGAVEEIAEIEREESPVPRSEEPLDAPDGEERQEQIVAARETEIARPEPRVESGPVPAETAAPRHGRKILAALLLAALAIGAAAVYLLFFKTTAQPESPPPTVASEPEVPSAEPQPLEPAAEPEQAAALETSADPPASSPVAPAAAPASLTVTEFGVGRRIVGLQLKDRTGPFEEGEVVWFSTRVVGGTSGQSIRHVWYHDGEVMQSIELELGGPHWRTHSSKTLWGAGPWAVEARDAGGRVLARTSFSCLTPGRPRLSRS